MGRDVEVCAKCTRKCVLVHGKKRKSSSAAPTSFFKVMIGDDFSRVLYLPPKFGPTVSDLVHEKITLEDSCGQQSNVTVSIINRSFVFQEGWNAFSLEHGLEVGDFLVFDYIKGSHFFVKIYDKSGCEKLTFPNKSNQNRRSTNTSGSAAGDGRLVRQVSNASVVLVSDVKNRRCARKRVAIEGSQNKMMNTVEAELYEDPYYLTDGDFGGKEREDRIPKFDVLSFEIWNNSAVDGNGTTTRDAKVSHRSNHYDVPQNDACLGNRDPMLEGVSGRVASSDEFDLTGRNNVLEATDKRLYVGDKYSCRGKTFEHLLITSTVQLEENEENNSIMPIWDAQNCQFAEGLGSSKITSGGMGQSSQTTIKDPPRICSEVKPESIDSESFPQNTVAVSCVVPPDNDSFLELPTRFPLSHKRGLKMGRMVVLLRDPLRRLWPVLYLEQLNFKILTSGWKAFSRANKIQPGDVCTFGVEDEFERIFVVNAIQNDGR